MENKESRRFFLSKAISGLGIALCAETAASILESCEFYEKNNVVSAVGSGVVEINTSTFPELSSLGIGIKRAFNDTKGVAVNNGYPLIITKIADDEFIVLTGLCTHEACYKEMMPPDKYSHVIICLCHGSTFDYKNGSVLQGPANKPLKAFANTFESSTGILRITIT